MLKILITGASGFVGRNMKEYLQKTNENYDIFTPSSRELNCIEETEVLHYLNKHHFDYIFHFASYGDSIDKSKDERGKSVYEYVKLDKPKLCSSDFWAERGGQLSYGNMQDEFYSTVSIRYGLERGEVGSNKKHTTKYQWQKQQQEAELANLEQEKIHAKEIIEQAQTAVAERDKALEELKPLQEYLNAFNEALSGSLPLSPTKLRKMIVGLTTEYNRLESEKKITDKDRENLFTELQALQKRIPTLEKYRDLVILLNDYAPDKLDEAKRTATERQTEKLKPKFKSSGNYKF